MTTNDDERRERYAAALYDARLTAAPDTTRHLADAAMAVADAEHGECCDTLHRTIARLRAEADKLSEMVRKAVVQLSERDATIDRMMSAVEKFGEHGLIVHVRTIVEEARS